MQVRCLRRGLLFHLSQDGSRGWLRQQRSAGHGYYATISLHNAAIATLNSGAFTDALALGYEALAEYDRLSFPAAERYSTHAVLATALFEVAEHEAETHIETEVQHKRTRMATSMLSAHTSL